MVLVRGGVPFDTAFALSDEYRAAFCIILGELEGGEFDWGAMAFKDPGK